MIKQRELSACERTDWLQLIRSANVGPITFNQLIAHCGGAKNALEQLPTLAQNGGASKRIKIADRGRVEDEIARLEKLGAFLICQCEAAFPTLLSQLEGAPPILFGKGRKELFDKPSVAIVGARNCSASGVQITTNIAHDLGKAGFVVVSGLARGIDGAAHQGALTTGTIAVMAGGLDKIYPPEHVKLADQIADKGLLICEMPLGWQARAQDFPRRNRIVSGMSLGTLVVEAAKRSGSLITARLAAEQNRDVFAIPGSPLDPRAAGPNELLKNGATITLSAQDIIAAFAPLHQSLDMLDLIERKSTESVSLNEEPTSAAAIESDARSAILNAMSPTPTKIDAIVRVTGATNAEVYLALMELELAGRLIRHPGQKVSLVSGYSE